MTLFLDTEFNGFGGALISIGLVSDRGGGTREFYAVCALPRRLTPWVKQHVVPFLGQKPEAHPALQQRLIEFLYEHEGEPIIADWPEDLMHLLRLLCASAGHAYRIDLELRLVKTTEDLASEVPHNALSDARALMRWYLARTA